MAATMPNANATWRSASSPRRRNPCQATSAPNALATNGIRYTASAVSVVRIKAQASFSVLRTQHPHYTPGGNRENYESVAVGLRETGKLPWGRRPRKTLLCRDIIGTISPFNMELLSIAMDGLAVRLSRLDSKRSQFSDQPGCNHWRTRINQNDKKKAVSHHRSPSCCSR